MMNDPRELWPVDAEVGKIYERSFPGSAKEITYFRIIDRYNLIMLDNQYKDALRVMTWTRATRIAQGTIRELSKLEVLLKCPELLDE